MNVIYIIFGIVIIIIGFLFAIQKLLPGAWKKMSDTEKAKIKIKPLCINIGGMIALCGSIILIRGLWNDFAGKTFTITMLIWFIISGLDILFITKSKQYYNE